MFLIINVDLKKKYLITNNYLNDNIGSQEIVIVNVTSQISVPSNIVAGDKVFANIIGTYHKILD